jgi:hypothetical protein
MPRQTIPLVVPHQDPQPWSRPDARILLVQLKLRAGLATGKEVDQRWCENLVRYSVPLAGQTPMQALGQRTGHCGGHAYEVVAASLAVEQKGRHCHRSQEIE